MFNVRVLFGAALCAGLLGGPALVFSQSFRKTQTSFPASIVGGKPVVQDFDKDGHVDLLVTHLFLPFTNGFAYTYRGTGSGQFVPGPLTPALPAAFTLPTNLVAAGSHLYISDSRGNVWHSQHEQHCQFSIPTLAIAGLPISNLFDLSKCDSILSLNNHQNLFVAQSSVTAAWGSDSRLSIRTVPNLKELTFISHGTVIDAVAGEFDEKAGDDILGLSGTYVTAKTFTNHQLFFWSPQRTGLFQHPVPLNPAFCVAFVRDGTKCFAYVSGVWAQKPAVVEYQINFQHKQFWQSRILYFKDTIVELNLFNSQLFAFGQNNLYTLAGEKILDYSTKAIETPPFRYTTVFDLNHDGNDEFIRIGGPNKPTVEVFISTKNFTSGWRSVPGTGSWKLACVSQVAPGNKAFSIVSQSNCVLGWNVFAAQTGYWGGLHVPPRACWTGSRFNFPISPFYKPMPVYFQAWKANGQISEVLQIVLPPP